MPIYTKDRRRWGSLNERAGVALGRCGRRKALSYALASTGLGSSKTRVHQMVADGDPTGWAQRAAQGIDALGQSDHTSPYPVIRNLLEVAEEARARDKTAEELCRRLVEQAAPAETKAQASEDVAELALVTAVWPIAFHGIDGLTLPQRRAVAQRIRAYLDAAANELDRQLEVMGDAAALLRVVGR